MPRLLLLCLPVLTLLAACGGDGLPTRKDAPLPAALLQSPTSLPGLPADSLQPWERLAEDGLVDPATARRSSAINGDSEFWRGVDAFETGGSSSSFGQALRLDSGSVGEMERSFAIYRIPLAGENPATLATDINLRRRNDGSASRFQLGIANYASGRWDWFGPFTDGRIRLPLSEAASADFISPLGNAFVIVLAYDGSSFDIVGISLNQFDPGDASAPPQPTGLSLAGRSGAVEMQWNGVIAGDLAGYRIYYSDRSFVNPGSAGVRSLPYLEGGTRHLLEGVSGKLFAAVSAVDLSGNEGPVSQLQSAVALAGETQPLEIDAGSADGILGSSIALTASGAASYDWDLDGDGTFEVTGDVIGSQLADTGKAGIIRPAVRGSDGATAVALGAVSLIIASDLPPVAVLTANRLGGAIIDGETGPLNINFSAAQSYDDAPGLEFSWALLGDGNFSPADPADARSQGYAESGIHNAMLRAVDSAGQYGQAQLTITVEQVTGFLNSYPVDNPSGMYGSLAIVEGRPAMLIRRMGAPPGVTGTWYCRARDSEGRSWGEPVLLAPAPNPGEYGCLAVIAGHPAAVWYNPNHNSIHYRRASSSTGQTAADWSNPTVLLAQPTAAVEEIELIDCNGNPALIWNHGNNIWFHRATSAAGTGDSQSDWGDPAFQIVNSGQADIRPDIKIIDGNPAVAYRNFSNGECHYKRASSSSGASPQDWPALGIVVSGTDTVDGRVNLEFVNGAPAVSYFSNSGFSSIRYTRANSSTGTSVGDWPVSTIVDEYSLSSAWHDLAVVGGRPAIAYGDFQANLHTKYRRASNANGSAWGPEQHVAPVDTWQDEAYEHIDLEDLNGFPALYIHNATQFRPMFATLDTEI